MSVVAMIAMMRLVLVFFLCWFCVFWVSYVACMVCVDGCGWVVLVYRRVSRFGWLVGLRFGGCCVSIAKLNPGSRRGMPGRAS